MSWSIGAIGKAPAVRKSIAEQISKGYKCAEPEETIRQLVGQILDVAISGQAENSAVRVNAFGSQSSNNNVVTSNQLSITVEPILNFVE